MSTNVNSIAKSVGKPTGTMPGNAGGIKARLILVGAGDVDVFPPRDADLVTIKTKIQMKTGKFMRELYVTTKTAAPKQDKIEGENADCGGFTISVEAFHPGFTKELQSFLAQYSAGCLMYVIFEDREGKRYLIGEPGNEAIIKTAPFEWGAAVGTGKKGTTITFEATQSLPMAFYEGDLTMDPLETGASSGGGSGSVTPPEE